MKKKDLIIVIIFILFITLPGILYWFLKDKMDNTNYENRNLYKKPELTLKTIVEFPKNYENYFNDHLPFKNEIRKTRSSVLYNLFNISTNSRVIVGEDGWLFYNSRAAEIVDSITDYRNITKYTKKEKENIKNSLLNTRDELNKSNVDFYVLVAPNKENIYSDKLDQIIKRSKKNESKTDDLIDYLQDNTNLNIVYPKEELFKSIEVNDTYYKYDTHWNDYGAYIGVKELMKKIDKDFDEPKITITKKKMSGDLASMNLMSKLKNSEPIVHGFYDEINYSCDTISDYQLCESDTPVYDKTIIFVGDSFREATVQYLAKLYKKSIFIHKDSYNEDFIKKYDANIVIYEAIERYSGKLASTYILTSTY